MKDFITDPSPLSNKSALSQIVWLPFKKIITLLSCPYIIAIIHFIYTQAYTYQIRCCYYYLNTLLSDQLKTKFLFYFLLFLFWSSGCSSVSFTTICIIYWYWSVLISFPELWEPSGKLWIYWPVDGQSKVQGGLRLHLLCKGGQFGQTKCLNYGICANSGR